MDMDDDNMKVRIPHLKELYKNQLGMEESYYVDGDDAYITIIKKLDKIKIFLNYDDIYFYKISKNKRCVYVDKNDKYKMIGINYISNFLKNKILFNYIINTGYRIKTNKKINSLIKTMLKLKQSKSSITRGFINIKSFKELQSDKFVTVFTLSFKRAVYYLCIYHQLHIITGNKIFCNTNFLIKMLKKHILSEIAH